MIYIFVMRYAFGTNDSKAEQQTRVVDRNKILIRID